MTRIGLAVLVSASALLGAAPGEPILRVGKGKPYATPSQAAAKATDGAVVEIDAGIYSKDAAVWRASNLKIRAVGTGRAHIKSDGVTAEAKGLWVMHGRNITVEKIEFSGATVPDLNGAGIRFQGSGLTVRDCFFHDNENGILAGPAADGDIVIEGSEFARNGHGDGYSHNLYIGTVRSLTIRFCYLHRAKIGHNLKSRALENTIAYNRIADEMDGTASYTIDLPNGGRTLVVGNVIHKGPKAENAGLLTYAFEGATNPVQEIYVVNNTFVNERSSATFVSLRGKPTARLVNNIFAGSGAVLSGRADSDHNLSGADPLFQDPMKGDYRLKKGSPAIDAGVAPGVAGMLKLTPEFHYASAKKEPRPKVGAIDLGAFEFTATTVVMKNP